MQQRIAELAKRRTIPGPGLGAATINDGPARTTFPMPFSFAGVLAVAESGPYYPHIATRLVTVHAALLTAGTSDTIITVNKNGSALSPTITLGSGVLTATESFYEGMTSDLDYLTMEITTVGAGAADLVVQARFG